MSRVKDNRDAQRIAEQRATEQKTQKGSRQAAEKFSRVVNEKQQKNQQNAQRATSQSQTSGQKAGKQGQAAGRSNQAQSALMARQGIASNQFAATLQKKGSENLGTSGKESSTRNEAMKEERVDGGERQQGTEGKKLAGQHDRLAAISRDDQPGSGQSGAGGGGQDNSELGSQHESDQAIAHADGHGIGNEAGPRQVLRAEAAGTQNLPPQAIQEIVKRVMVGINAEGLGQFHIEFKQDVLGGLRLQVEAKDGKVSAKFITDDVNIQRLLKASEGQLARAFGQKGMYLQRMDVERT